MIDFTQIESEAETKMKTTFSGANIHDHDHVVKSGPRGSEPKPEPSFKKQNSEFFKK